ncbi:tRNA (cytidine(34)-2'-O)-methyltransferase [Oceanobacillus kimchii]|uniref:tRNA (cytidine(34)-2'-O)-methyltransferase n=1 Tax=Oceanobacillus kimchii TaxID=746691 RepID=UPI00232AEEED|nr:tRNA (cytidine(34)-2'-O)-methyltransferase [Oceanobacillus kimchii]
MSVHVVLFEPEIPANTGNIGRTCLATGVTLHLIHPLGFSTDSKMVRRAGLDYWEHVDVQEYQSIEELYETYPDAKFYYIENFATKHYTDFDFSDSNIDQFFVFGKESTGIPKELLVGKEDQCLRIHMNNKVRSLNLSNTSAIIIYEVLRQQGFPNLY